MSESRIEQAPPRAPALAGRLRGFDRVVLTTVLVFLVLLILRPDQFLASLTFTADALLRLSPFLAASVIIGAGAKATGVDNQIGRFLQGRQLAAITVAALFGALSPFCSCGVVPIVAALLAAGVPLAPVMAFWIASPIMDPQMFLLTAAVLGTPFAVGKTVAAIGMGLLAGFGTLALSGRPSFAEPLLDGAGGRKSCCSRAPSPLRPAPVVWTFWRHHDRRGTFSAEAGSVGFFLTKWLTLAFVLESLMVAWVPGDSVAAWLGGDAWWAIPAAVLVGVPAYLNGYAAIPTVDALIDLGMAQGAAMAFMVAGAVTSLPASMAVFAIARRPVFLWYLAMGLAGSLAAGLLWQVIA